MRYATYRIGNDHYLPEWKNGTEVTEETTLDYCAFIDETEKALGPVSLLWMGTIPMPSESIMGMIEKPSCINKINRLKAKREDA